MIAPSDAIGRRHVLVLERVRERRVEAGDAQRSAPRGDISALLGDRARPARRRSRTSSAPRARSRTRPVLLHRREDRVDVERQQRAQVDHLGVEARRPPPSPRPRRTVVHHARLARARVTLRALAHDLGLAERRPCSRPRAPRPWPRGRSRLGSMKMHRIVRRASHASSRPLASYGFDGHDDLEARRVDELAPRATASGSGRRGCRRRRACGSRPGTGYWPPER